MRPPYSLAAVLVGGLVTSTAHGQVQVQIEGCELDRQRVAEQVDLEVGLELEDVPWSAPPQITATCAGELVRLTVEDPVTGKHVERSIPAPATDRDRVVAIAASQLLLSSWLELLAFDPPAPEPAQAETVPLEVRRRQVARARARARRAVRDGEVTEPLSTDIFLRIGGGVRLGGDAVVPSAASGLGAGVWLSSRLRLSLTANAELDWISRDVGRVVGRSFGLSIGGTYRVPLTRAWSWSTTAGLSAGIATLDGQPQADDVTGRSVTGAAAGAGLASGPRLDTHPLHLELMLDVSAQLVGPEGLVGTEEPARLHGLRMGLVLAVGLGAPPAG